MLTIGVRQPSWPTCRMMSSDWAVPGELDVVDDRAVAEPDQPFDSGSDLRVVGGDEPVAQAVACQRLTFEARAPRCGRYGCATAGRVKWT